MRVYIGSGSDVGRMRNSNQDAIGMDLETGLFLVADGAGGHAGGEIASSIVTSLAKEYVASSKSDYQNRVNALMRAIRDANARIFQIASTEIEKRGMASTVTALLIGSGKYFIAHVGDSRAYLIRGRDIIQITKDHSFVQQLVDSGIINSGEARNHERRNEITRAVGIAPEIEIDTYEGEYRETDILLLCSDGLWGEIDEREIFDAVMDSEDAQQACNTLIDLANKKGGRDNISVILAQSFPTVRKVLPRRRKIFKLGRLISPALARGIAIGSGAVAFLILLILLFSPLVIPRPPKEGWIRFITKPETLKVVLIKTGKDSLITNNDSLRVPFGDTLVFSKRGFYDTAVIITELTAKECTIELKPRLIPVNFITSLIGTEIYFKHDGRKVKSIESLPFGGSFHLRCKHPDYLPCETTLQIVSTEPINFEPVFKDKKPKPPPPPPIKIIKVRFTAWRDPTTRDTDERIDGAEILINGQPKGRVPNIIELEAGKRYTAVLRCKDGVNRKRDLREVQEKKARELTYFGRDFK